MKKSKEIRSLSNFALVEKMASFKQILNPVLKTMCKHMAEKSGLRDDKNGHFSKQSEIRKRSIEYLTKKLVDFFEERGWTKWHSPKNIVMALASEVGELIDPFRFLAEEESFKLDKKSSEAVSDELGDVMICVTYLAHLLGMDLIKAALKKIANGIPHRS